MPRKSINQQQVKLYMSYRIKPKQSQAKAAEKAGFLNVLLDVLIVSNMKYKVNRGNTAHARIHSTVC